MISLGSDEFVNSVCAIRLANTYEHVSRNFIPYLTHTNPSSVLGLVKPTQNPISLRSIWLRIMKKVVRPECCVSCEIKLMLNDH